MSDLAGRYSYSKYDQMAKGTGKFTEPRSPADLVVDGVIENGDGTYTKNTIRQYCLINTTLREAPGVVSANRWSSMPTTSR